MAKTREHRSIPYIKIAKFWQDGRDYTFIAKHIDRFDEKSSDPTKSTRAIVSRMLTVGYKDENGKLVKLGTRPGMRSIGVGKKAPKVAKAKAAKAKVAKAKAAKSGLPVLIQLHDNKKFVRVVLGKRERLLTINEAKPQLESVLNAINATPAEMVGNPAPAQPEATTTVETPAPATPAPEASQPATAEQAA